MIEYLNEAATEASRITHGVAPEQLGGPTPCGQWDVAALVNHWVLYTSHGLECRAQRVPLPACTAGTWRPRPGSGSAAHRHWPTWC
jgi:hypothetical protein